MRKKRKNEVKFRHRVVRRVFKFILWPFFKFKYKYNYKYYKDLKNKGPFLILANHTIAVDPILLSFAFPFHIYYIASEQIFNLGLLSKLLLYLVNPISKTKATSDVTTIRKAKRIVNEGGSIGVYPEGNVTYDGGPATINKSIVKLVRLLKIDIIVFGTKGLYLSDPRWAINQKKGKSSGKILKNIKKEEYDKLSDDELYELIKETLNFTAYEQQEENLVKFKGKELAKGLERLVFIDLDTNKPFVTYTKGNVLKSTDSNFSLTYDEYGYVYDKDNKRFNLIEINNLVKEKYLNYYNNLKEDFIYEELVKLEVTTNKEKSNKGEAHLKLYKNKLILNNKELLYDDLSSIAIQGKRKIIVYNSSKTYLITFKDNSSPYKYLLTYQIYKKEKNEDGITSIQQLGL